MSDFIEGHLNHNTYAASETGEHRSLLGELAKLALEANKQVEVSPIESADEIEPEIRRPLRLKNILRRK